MGSKIVKKPQENFKAEKVYQKNLWLYLSQ